MNNNMLYTEEKCDVTLPWQQDFWISTIFLERDDHLIVERWKKSMGYPVLLLSAIMRMKVIQIIQINCDICNNTVYRDREVLLPQQRDVTTSLVILSIT